MSDALTAKNLSVRLGERDVLAGVDVFAASGRITVLIGPNGSGKTTLIRALLGRVPAGGTIAVLGKPLASWKKKELARTIAYLPQTPFFEPGDRVIDVIRLGRTPHGGWLGLDDAAGEQALAAVARDLALTGLLNRPIETLSGGQRQRVFLGRSLVQEPKILLLDEPATYLDVQHQVDLHRQLRTLARDRGLAVLMASHDLNLAAAHADTAVLLKDGRTLAAGPVEHVMTGDRLTAAFGTPMKRIDLDGRRYIVAEAAAI